MRLILDTSDSIVMGQHCNDDTLLATGTVTLAVNSFYGLGVVT